jgi:sulfonate transport system substrate-binding protein
VARAAGDYAGNGVVIAHRAILEQPDRVSLLGDYLLRFRQVLEWIASHQDAWADILTKETGIERSYYLDWRKQQKQPSRLVAIDDRAIADQQTAADLFRRFGITDGTFNAAPLWDRRFGKLLS